MAKAKKEEKEFSYGSAYLPEGEKKYSVIRWGWKGLNREDQIDTGQLADMSGVVCDMPYMLPQHKGKLWVDLKTGIPYNGATVDVAMRIEGTPFSIAGFDNQLLLLWEHYSDLTGYQVISSGFAKGQGVTYLGEHEFDRKNAPSTTTPRSVLQFNVVDTSSGNIVNYTYDRRLLVYPDCESFDYDEISTAHQGQATPFNTQANPIPVSKYATVYGSRVFGVSENATFASDYNNYAAYNLDTADDVSSANAWWSMTNTNTDADGAFTAICTYDNHVVLFKKDFMQLVYNNKNPFRIVDVGAYGCDSNKAWTILNNVLYFASSDKIYAFTGGTPKEISSKLEVSNFSYSALGSFRDTLWVQTDNDGIYTYKDGVWSKADASSLLLSSTAKVKQFATLDYALVALVQDSYGGIGAPDYKIMYLDWDNEHITWEDIDPTWTPEYGDWWFETDLMALGKLDVRRVKKLSVLCEGSPGGELNVYLLKPNEVFNPSTSECVGTVKFAPASGTPPTGGESGFKMLRVLTRQFSSTMHRLRFTGKKYVKIYAAELKISWGGELYVEAK